MINRIQIDPTICHGKPTIRGTRVLVSTVLGGLAAGDSMDSLLEDYPNISLADIHAALEFGSELSRFEERPYEMAAL